MLKNFFLVVDTAALKTSVFSPSKHFQPSLTFVNKTIPKWWAPFILLVSFFHYPQVLGYPENMWQGQVVIDKWNKYFIPLTTAIKELGLFSLSESSFLRWRHKLWSNDTKLILRKVLLSRIKTNLCWGCNPCFAFSSFHV